MYNNTPPRVLTGEVRLSVMPIPVHDGDGVRDNGTPYGSE